MRISGYAGNFLMLLRLGYQAFQANKTFGIRHLHARWTERRTSRESRRLNDGTIPEKVYKKIQWYMVSTVFLGEILAGLASQKLRKKERQAFRYFGALMALFDAFTDELKLDKEVLSSLLSETAGQATTPASGHTAVKVFRLYAGKLRSTVTPLQWQALCRQMELIHYQLESHSQQGEGLTETEVMEITLGKGGAAILMCAGLLPLPEGLFTRALAKLGGFIQMMNDSQDLYKDFRDGIYTFVRFRSSFRDVSETLDHFCNDTLAEIKALPVPVKAKYRTMLYFHAMHVVMQYKLHRYAKACGNSLDPSVIALMDKKKFRVNPFTLHSARYCFGKVMRFRHE